MTITIPIISEFKGKGFKDAQKQTDLLDKSLKRLAITLGTALSARKVAQFSKASILAASNLEEAMSKVGVVFGRGAAEVEAFGRSSAASLGLSSSAALEAAGTYGNLLQAFGIGQREAQGMSLALVKLAADMASFNNTSIDQAITALRSGLSGETEPLKRYGVALQDVRLRTEALRLGLVRNVREALTPAVKAQAAYALIMKDTALAQGDFERTAGGVANSLRIISASAENARTIIGERLISSLDLLIDRKEGVEALANSFEKMATDVGDIALGLASVVKQIKGIGQLIPGGGLDILAIPVIGPYLDFLRNRGRSLSAQEESRKAAIAKANAKEQGMLAARGLQTQRKLSAELDKQLKIKKKTKDLDKEKLDDASKMFEDERISIAAALKNESLDRNEILRLELKRAIINENANKAEKLADQLAQSQAELAKLAAFRLANPFQEWEDSLAKIRAGMASIGVPVAPVSPQGTISGQAPMVPSIVPPGQTGAIPPSVTQEDLFEGFGRGSGVTAPQININVSGTGDLSDDTKKKIVDTIIDYSAIGYSTSGWYRTTGNVTI